MTRKARELLGAEKFTLASHYRHVLDDPDLTAPMNQQSDRLLGSDRRSHIPPMLTCGSIFPTCVNDVQEKRRICTRIFKKLLQLNRR